MTPDPHEQDRSGQEAPAMTPDPTDPPSTRFTLPTPSSSWSVSHLTLPELVLRMKWHHCKLAALETLERLGSWPSDDPVAQEARHLADRIWSR
jgi:hypothetical protein